MDRLKSQLKGRLRFELNNYWRDIPDVKKCWALAGEL